MNKSDFTIDAYNEKAEEISKKFRSLGPRIGDIERAINLAGASSKLKAIELGSGDGRDAAEIIKRVDSYIGVEPSKGLLDIAQTSLPHAQFIQATAQEYEFPAGIDIIFAFASLLHVNREDLGIVFSNIHKSLNMGGILYLSLKESPNYLELVTDDIWGKRQFYHYSKQNIVNIAGSQFESIYEDHQIKGDTKWLTIALKKIN